MTFGPDVSGSCDDGFRSTPTATGNGSHTVTIFGLKLNQAYDWKAHAAPPTDPPGSPVHSSCNPVTQITTAATLPFTHSPNLGDLTVATDGTAGSVQTVLTHYGCDDGGGAYSHEALVIFDEVGDIMWYQDPTDDPTLTNLAALDVSIEAMSLSRPGKHILAILNREYIVEYDLAGNLVHMICREDTGGLCASGDTPDLALPNDAYLHHDVELVDDVIWILNARESWVDDVLDPPCGSDPTYPIILDGLFGIGVSGGGSLSLDTDWTWLDAPQTVDYTVATGCGGAGYWGGMLLGADYMHTNSFWIDSGGYWTISQHALDQISIIDGSDGTFYEEICGEGTCGDSTAGDYTFDTGGSYSDAFAGQHDVFWNANGELMLFDNDSIGSYTRGVTYDRTGSVLNAIKEYQMNRIGPHLITCNTQGSALGMIGGHVLATCPNASGQSRAVFNEFSASNTIVWTAEMTCGTGPSLNATRGYANPWTAP